MATIGSMYVPVQEAAKELNVSPQCVRTNYLRTGQLRGEFVAGRWLIPREELERFKKASRPHGVTLAYRQNGSPRKKNR